MVERLAGSAGKAAKLADPYKAYGGQLLEFYTSSVSIHYTTVLNMHETLPNAAGFLPASSACWG